jgi:N-acetylneuraminate synthase
MAQIKIANRVIGDNHPPVVIAEIGINHGGSLDLAKRMVDAALGAGAEIIKHQTHIIDDEMSEEAKKIIPGNSDRSIFDIMEECALSHEDERSLMNYVEKNNAIFISTPFSRAAADRLVGFNVPAFKIGSGECNNYPLVKHIAEAGKPVIMSTGMNTIETVKKSVEILRSANVSFALLHTTNIYPTPIELVRLGAMTELKQAFPDAVIGLSDHTEGNFACFGAAALGASILERHFTDDMDRKGPDIVCSMDPFALNELIKGTNAIYLASGGKKGPVVEEQPTIAFAFVSVVAIADIESGEPLTKKNIWVKRPGGGDFNGNDFENLLGKTAFKKIRKGFQIKASDIV